MFSRPSSDSTNDVLSNRQLNEPRPHIVGMDWVATCAHQTAHVDETEYLIDMDDLDTTANLKVTFSVSLFPFPY
jgi:hypothetical protein